MALLPFSNAPGTAGGGGTVTSVSINTANGFAGTVANPTTTPALTLQTSITGIIKGNGTAISAATSGTDYAPATSGTSALKGNGAGGFSNATLNDVGAATADYSINSHKLTSVSDPTSAQDAATKNYVDAVAQGLSVKPSAIVATTTGLPAYTYLAGVITMTSTGVVAVDGHNLALNDVVLVKDETSTNAPYNGLYTVTTAGAVGVACVLTRSTSMDSSTEFSGGFVFVESGTVNAAAGFVCTNTGSVTVGVTNITFTQFSGAGEITAGNGLSKSGNTLSIDTSITVDKTTAQTLTNKTLTTPKIASLYQDSIGGSNLLTMPATTDTLVGKATTDTFTNKTFDTAGTGNVLKINGTTVSDKTGTGKVVLDTSPTLVTPLLGTPTSGVMTNVTGLPLTTGVTGILGAANGGTGVANNAASTLTISGNFGTTLTVSGTTSVTLPTSGTLATLAGAETLTNKEVSGGVVESDVFSDKLTTQSVTLPTGRDFKVTDGFEVASGQSLEIPATSSLEVDSPIYHGSVDFGSFASGALRLGLGYDTGATLTTSYVTHATVTATSHGGVVECVWGAQVANGNSGADRTFTMQILCDGNVVPAGTVNSLNFDTPFISGVTTNLSYGFIHSHQPGAGSHTWQLQFLASTAAAVVLASNFLRIQEVV